MCKDSMDHHNDMCVVSTEASSMTTCIGCENDIDVGVRGAIVCELDTSLAVACASYDWYGGDL